MPREDAAELDIISRALAKNRLGVPSVVFFGVAGAAPLTVIIGAISTIYAVVGNTAVPLVYLVVALALGSLLTGWLVRTVLRPVGELRELLPEANSVRAIR